MTRALFGCLTILLVACQADFDPALLQAAGAGGSATASGGASTAGKGGGGAGTASVGGGDCPADELCAGDNCCASLAVAGGDFDRSYDASGSDEEPQSSDTVTGFQMRGAAPAKISSFELDEFEVTVARFRRFVAAYDAWRAAGNPMAGAAAHAKISGSGWQSDWDELLPSDASTLEEELDCGAQATYPDTSEAGRTLPVNCLTWYSAAAYCAWAGKRLPTEAEWNFAAAGGNEQRAFPWSSPPATLTITSALAVYGDVDIGAVGSVAAKDTGRFGHHDLAGNLREWTLDVSGNVASYVFADACEDCAALSGGTRRTRRGGDFAADAARARTAYRSDADPSMAQVYNGVRCAR